MAPARPGEEALNERLTESFLENKDVGLLSATVEASQTEQSGAEDPDAEVGLVKLSQSGSQSPLWEHTGCGPAVCPYGGFSG